MDSTDWHKQTIDTYNQSAEQLAAYFAGIGARISDIERGLILAKKPSDARVVEIGCGDGRDAEEIVKRVKTYQGFDPSTGMLAIARKKVPQAKFILADALSFKYPTNQDVIFAFASILHIPRKELETLFRLVYGSLRVGGIWYISTKEASEYLEKEKEDQHGKRKFYFYSTVLLVQLAENRFTVVYEDHQTLGHTAWLTLALQKTV